MHRAQRLRRGFASAAGKPSGPAQAAKPAAPSSAPAATKPATAVPAPAKPSVPSASPGAEKTKQGAGAGSILIPLLAIGGAAGGYYAYETGAIPADLFGLAPLLGLPGADAEDKKKGAASAVSQLSPAPVAAPASPAPAKPAQAPAPAPAAPKAEAPKQAPVAATAAATSSSAAAAKPPAVAPSSAPVEAPKKKEEAKAPQAPAVDEKVELHRLLWAKQLAQGLVAAETAPAKKAAAPAPAATPAEKKAAPAPAKKAPEAAPPAAATSAPAATPAPAAAPAPPSPLVKAKEEVASWKVEQLKSILSNATSAEAESIGREVDVLSAAELREKVLKLSAEIATRSKHEAVHLIELLKQADQQWEGKFEAYAKAKHAEAEAFVRDQLTAAKSVLDKEFQEAARQAKQEIENEAEAKYSQKAKKEIAQALDQMGNEAEARVKKMEKLRTAVLGPTESLLSSRLDYEEAARKAHRVNAAVLALGAALNEPRPATQEVAALKVAGEGDRVIGAAIALLPAQVHGTKGVPSLSNLQLRFSSVLHAARVASLTPEGTGVIGQAVGSAAAKLVVPATSALLPSSNSSSSSSSASSSSSSVSASSPVASPSTAPNTAAAMERSVTSMVAPFFSTAKDGVASLYSKLLGSSAGQEARAAAAGPAKELQDTAAAVKEAVRGATGKVKEVAAVAKERTQEVRSFNETLERVESMVQKGDLDGAVKILESLEGSPAEVAREWVEHARLRIATDRAASVARSRAVVLTAAMY